MLIFQIFSLRETINDAKEASSDPMGFGSKIILKNIRDTVIFSLIGIFFLLIVSFIFGYTSLFAGPYGIAKFLFWIFVIPSVFLLPVLFYALRATLKALRNVPKKVQSKVI